METSALIGQAQSSWLIFGAPSQPQLTELKSLNMIQTNKKLIGTQNTSGEMLTRRNKTTSQFLIGTEMRLFGVPCRPERSRGIGGLSRCTNGCPHPRQRWRLGFSPLLSTLNCQLSTTS